MVVVVGCLLLSTVAAGVGVAANADAGLVLRSSANLERNVSTGVEFKLPRNVAAVDGRLYFDKAAVEVVGLAPVGGGVAFRPVDIEGGVAFGAYNLKPSGGSVTMRVVVAPLATARVELRLSIDAAADAAGRRIQVPNTRATGTLRVADGGELVSAPSPAARPIAPRPGGPTVSLFGDGRLSVKDLDIAVAGWEYARFNESVCAQGPLEGDANGDGCVDIVDVQAVAADQGRRVNIAPNPVTPTTPITPTTSRPFAARAGAAMEPGPIANASGGPNFVVDSTADTADANQGDGICADSLNRCTFRAAVTEANWWPGANRIEFNLIGIAPVRIQLATNMPLILVSDANTTIDGYTQPGSQVNTAQVGSNAIMGVEFRGNGNSPQAIGIRVGSRNNTIRGILFNNHYRAISFSGPNAQDNLFVGNWVGYNPSGTPHSYNGNYNILLDGGASNNRIGTPNLADRNVSGRATHAVDLYGPGTNGNIVQNNLLCTTPSGFSTAQCNTGVDHNHGPKNGLIGGTGVNERNVIGRTALQGIEYSHGFNPSGGDNGPWQVNNNRSINNWVGFRGDGSYDAAFRSGQNNPGTADNGNGINAYDGSNFNTIEGNYVASVWDGIQTMSSNATGNIIRNNIIGMSPTGQAAPITRYGIVARLSTRTHLIEGNLIRNTANYGIAITHPAVRFVRLSRNIIMDTNAAPIFLAPDPANPGIGANNLQPAPVITSATTNTVGGTGTPAATVEVYRASRPAGQVGLPIEFLGSTTVAGNGTWSMPISVATNTVLTALQTHTNGNSSAMSTNVATSFQPPPPAPTANFTWVQQAGTLTVNFTDTSTGNPTGWSWDFGDGGTSTQRNPSHTYSSADDYTVVLTASNAGGSTQSSQTVTVAEPPSDEVLISDTFTRTFSNGWGNAETGGAYTIQGTSSNYNVAGGEGTIVVPNAGGSRSALLGGSERDVELSVKVAADKAASGGAYYVYALARRNGTNEYRAKLVFNANGTISVHGSVLNNNSESSLGNAVVVPGLTQTPGALINLKAEFVGANPTTIRIKAWADGQAEPGGWLFTATNSTASVQSNGAFGLRLYAAGSVNNAPVQFRFDDYQVIIP
jgi:CSLREA domain-containing protein